MTGPDRHLTGLRSGVWALVVCAVIFAFMAWGVINTAHDEAMSAAASARDANIARIQLAVRAREVVRDGCERDNRTRAALRVIIQRGDRNLRGFYRDGTINKAQYDRSLRLSRRARADLADVDCDEAANRLPAT